MAKKNMILTVFLWLEIIVCLRVLVFLIPVWINHYSTEGLGGMMLNDWFMAVLTVAVLLHALAAMISFKNFNSGRWIHYLCLLIVGLMTFGLAVLSRNVLGTIVLPYVYPLIGSCVFIIMLNLAKGKKEVI